MVLFFDFFNCYAFKGQSYYASQKLKTFTETIKISDSAWEILEEASEYGMDVSEEQDIKVIVDKIFLASDESQPLAASVGVFSQKVTLGISRGIFLDSIDCVKTL